MCSCRSYTALTYYTSLSSLHVVSVIYVYINYSYKLPFKLWYILLLVIPDEDSFAKTSNGIANHILARLITIFPIIIIIITRYYTYYLLYCKNPWARTWFLRTSVRLTLASQVPFIQEPVKLKIWNRGSYLLKPMKNSVHLDKWDKSTFKNPLNLCLQFM